MKVYSAEYEGTSVVLVADPTGHYGSTDPGRLIEAVGLITAFVGSYTGKGTIKDALEKAYGFGKLADLGGKVTKSLTYEYPQDPKLYPLVSISNSNMEIGDIVLVYECGIVAIREGSTWFVTRMD